MANCKNCGVVLPTSSFGDLSDYCKACGSQKGHVIKKRLIDELPKLAETSPAWPAGTVLLIAVSVGVFVAMAAQGISATSPETEQLLRWGADFGPLTLGGQYWRLITSSFLHIGFLHLALNMASLWIIGRMVEKLFGAFVLVGIYLLTGIGAGLLTLSWDPMRVSAGASGAIFGLVGVLIPVLYYGKLGMEKNSVRRVLAWSVRIALINLLYGLGGNVDNMAHLGGLVTGLLTGLFFARTFASLWQDRVPQQTRILATTAFLLLLVLVPVKRAKTYAVELQKAETALDNKDYELAIVCLRRYTGLKPDDARGHALLGYALDAATQPNDAVPEYERALLLEPDTPWVEFDLATIYYYQHKPAQAVALYRQSISKIKASAMDYRYYGAALYASRNYADAEDALQHSLVLDQKDPVAHNLMADVYDKLGKTKQAKEERQRASKAEAGN